MAAKITSYIDSRGEKRTGYIIDGSTYTDPAGKTPVEKGSIVEAGGGLWIKGMGKNGESMLYSDYLKGLEAQKPGLSQPEDPTPAGSSFLTEPETRAKARYDRDRSLGESVYADAVLRAEQETRKQKESVEQSYGELGTQLYRDYMEQKKNLPQLLAAQGIKGGLSESSLVGLRSAYQGELASAERAKLGELSNIDARAEETARRLLLDKQESEAKAEEAYAESLAEIAEKRAKEEKEAAETAAAEEKRLLSEAYEKAEILAEAGDFSGYRALGFTEAEIAALEKAYYESQFNTRLKIAQQKARYGDPGELLALLRGE